MTSTYASPLWVIGGLVAGIGLGMLASTSGSPVLLSMVRFVEPAGTVFVNAIRMAVIPLVVACLIVGIVSIGDERSLTRLGVRSLLVVFGLALSAAGCATLVAAPVPARLDINASNGETTEPPRGQPTANRRGTPRRPGVGTMGSINFWPGKPPLKFGKPNGAQAFPLLPGFRQTGFGGAPLKKGC